MAPLRFAIALALFAGCVHQDQTVDTAFPEPTVIAGPPGGEMDPAWQPGGTSTDPSGYGEVVASADPSAPGYVMGEVTDPEIDQTLEGYGEWIEVDGYGEVWRPYATEVGVDFTPYETCGSWVWTSDWGWVYGCDWQWGWLPFHYGQWGWFDDYWAWVPDYEWSPAWVDWRGGGGYVGWRPQAPVVRDHRHHHQGPVVRDHRTHHGLQSVPRIASIKESMWRFAATSDFGKPHIRAHLFKNPEEGLRVTQLATRPPLVGTVQPVRAASIMSGRLGSLGLDGRAGAGPVRSRRPSPDTTRAIEGAYVSGAVQPSRGHTPSFGADESDDGRGVFAPGIMPGTEGGPMHGGTSGDATPQSYGDGSRSGGPGNNIDPATPATPQPDPSRDPSEWQPATPAQPTWGSHANDSTWQPATPQQPSWNSHVDEATQPATPAQPTWGSHANDSTWQPATPAQPSWNSHANDSTWQPATPAQPSWNSHANDSSWQPAQPARNPRANDAPAQPAQPDRPRWMTHDGPPTWRPTQPAQPTWTPPSRPSSPPSSWQPAQPSHSSPSTWSPPASHSSSPPSSWQPAQPSHSSPPASHSSSSSWSPPASHSSGSFSPSHSSSPPASQSSSFGGGGHSSGGFSGGGHSGGRHR